MSNFTINTQRTMTVDELDLTFPVNGLLPDTHDEVWVKSDGNVHHISWLVQDDDGYNMHEWDSVGTEPKNWSNGLFRDFRNQYDGGGEEARNAFIAEWTERLGEDHVFIVDVYSHGLDHYSVSNSRWYPDRQWDVAPACVLVVPPDVTDPRCWADGMMGSWTSVCNGDVWGIVTLTVDSDGKVLDEDSCWGFIGRQYAEEAAKEGY
jgi:hypothetical protein